MSTWSQQQIATAIAQARKWIGSRNNGWAPTRPQVAVLADTVEQQREEIDQLRAEAIDCAEDMDATCRHLRRLAGDLDHALRGADDMHGGIYVVAREVSQELKGLAT